MELVDIFLVLLLLAALTGAVIALVRRKRSGKTCCGDCTSCPGCQERRPK